MSTYSKEQIKEISTGVERDIKSKFGWIVKFNVTPSGKFGWDGISGEDRYDLYPAMSKEEADRAIIEDVLAIIRRHIPRAKLTDYCQHGNMHYL